MKREKFQLGKGKYSNYKKRKHCNQKKENIPITKRKYIQEWKLRIEQIMVQSTKNGTKNHAKTNI